MCGKRRLEGYSTMKRVSTLPSAEPISIVSAADDNYAMPLAVTIRSVIDSLHKHQPLAVNILDGGLTDESKRRLARSWSARNISIAWLSPPVEQIADLKTENH